MLIDTVSCSLNFT